MDTVTTSRRGIFAAGASLGPADLEDCASSAGLAAVKALSILRRKTLAAG
jgi:heterodisulfide reductase subunit A